MATTKTLMMVSIAINMLLPFLISLFFSALCENIFLRHPLCFRKISFYGVIGCRSDGIALSSLQIS